MYFYGLERIHFFGRYQWGMEQVMSPWKQKRGRKEKIARPNNKVKRWCDCSVVFGVESFLLLCPVLIFQR
jgi:hypothetical protein